MCQSYRNSKDQILLCWWSSQPGRRSENRTSLTHQGYIERYPLQPGENKSCVSILSYDETLYTPKDSLHFRLPKIILHMKSLVSKSRSIILSSSWENDFPRIIGNRYSARGDVHYRETWQTLARRWAWSGGFPQLKQYFYFYVRAAEIHSIN